MATTTNYSWTTPDDTDLVKDGAAAIRTLGTAIDSTVFTNAGAAVAKATVDAKGDLIVGTADNTIARLAVGVNDTVLIADSSTATGLKWAAPVSSGGMTLVETLTLSGASTTSASIAGTYKHLFVVVKNATASTNTDFYLRMNGDTGANYFRNVITTSSPSGLSGSAVLSQNEIRLNDIGTATGAAERVRGNFWVVRYTDTDETYVTAQFFGYEGAQKATVINGVYNNSAAITSITLGVLSGTMSNGNAYIYGVN
jgi:predicted secreted protein